MNTQGKLILAIITVLVLFVIGFKYNQYYLQGDFLVQTQVNCDPQTESCFRVTEENRDTETIIIFMDGSPYKYVEMPAYLVPVCLEDITCLDFTCEDVGEDCETYYCDPEDPELDTEWEECVFEEATEEVSGDIITNVTSVE